MNYPSSEFDKAVAQLCHGTINDTALAALHELLRSNLEARDDYLWRVEIHGELASGRLDFRGPDIGQQAEQVSTTFLPTRSRSMFGDWRVVVPACAAALLVVSVLGGSALLLQDSQPEHPVAEHVVARIVRLDGSRWMNSTTNVVVGDAVRRGQRIELSSGIAEVEFESGARLTIAGPSIVEPLSENSAFLMMGHVGVSAEKGDSYGFTLVTQNSTFMDAETAFTASVAPDGLSCLEVSKGDVDVEMEGTDAVPCVRAGESLFVETGEQRVITRIESGDGTSAFEFPSIEPPSSEDYADQSMGHATVRTIDGRLSDVAGGKSSINVLLNGSGQKRQDAPRQSAFFESRTGSFLVDLGQNVSVSRINTYSWHQHNEIKEHRHRAQQRFTLYGFTGDSLPDLTLPADEAGWTRIARVNSDRFFDVHEQLDRPAQQACSISRPEGEIGRFRYLLWEVQRGTFYGEIDVYAAP